MLQAVILITHFVKSPHFSHRINGTPIGAMLGKTAPATNKAAPAGALQST
jgi:hypothetical protein